MSTETPEAPKDAHTAFAQAGLSLPEMQRRLEENRKAGAMASAAGDVPGLAMPRSVQKCGKCGTPLPDGQFFICDQCAEANERREEVQKKNPPPIPASEVGSDFPARHRGEIEGYHGPALAKAGELLPRVLEGSMLLLYGLSGTGKTGIATWLEWNRLKRRKRPGQFFTLQELFSLIKGTWSRQAKESEHDLVRRICECPYTVVDEIDEGSGSAWEESTFFDIANRIYNNGNSIVLLSNRDADELKVKYSKKFLDRFSEAGGLVHCKWPSYRSAKINTHTR